MNIAEFEDTFNIPHCILTLQSNTVCEFRKPLKELNCSNKSFQSKNKTTLSIEYYGLYPQPEIAENNNAACIIFGSPIYNNEKVDREKTAQTLLNNFTAKTVLELIDGEFLAIHFDKTTGELKTINDRWCSVQFHYYISSDKKFFCASPYFFSLWQFLKINNLLEINQEAFLEMLYFQRLFADKTLAKNACFMPDAHILHINHEMQIKLERYWQRSYTKNKNSFEDNAQTLADMVEFYLAIKTADNKKYGHFLSGGMDSRSVLAAFKDNLPVCFTVGASENREVKTARKIAETKGAKHVFLKLDPEHYGKIREAATKICGGMYNYDHALFLGYSKVVSSQAEICFNGYGFDFMFQGMYIPTENLKIMGRNLNFVLLSSLPDNLTEYFIKNASYRIKNANVWSFIKENKTKELKSVLYESINFVLNQGKGLIDSKFDLWEYLTFHYLSRHYSYPNVLSIKTFSEARVLSFTNKIFDFYLSLPLEHRFDGKIEKRLLQLLNRKIARIPSANTAMPVTAGRFKRTTYQIAKAIKRRLLFQKDFESWTERTWPSREYALKNQPSLKNAVLQIINSDTLEQLDFLDTQKIKTQFNKWLNGEQVQGISGDLVQTITTIGTFLKSK